MNRRERLSGVMVLTGMFLTATDSIPTAITAVSLLGAGVILANWPEIRRWSIHHAKKRPAERQLKRSNEDITFKF